MTRRRAGAPISSRLLELGNLRARVLHEYWSLFDGRIGIVGGAAVPGDREFLRDLLERERERVRALSSRKQTRLALSKELADRLSKKKFADGTRVTQAMAAAAFAPDGADVSAIVKGIKRRRKPDPRRSSSKKGRGKV